MSDVEVVFGGRTEGVAAAVAEVVEQIESLTAAVESVMSIIPGIGELIAASLAVDKVTEFIEHMAELGTEVERTTKMLGLSAEEASTLALASQLTGGSIDGASSALQRLSRNVQLAIAGSTQQKAAFDALGISTQFLRDHQNDLQVILGKIADRFESAPDGATKTAVAIELLGRSGAQMIPILDEGSSGLDRIGDIAQETGTKLSRDTVEGMAATHRGLVTLSAATEGLGIAVFNKFKGAIDGVTGALTHLIEGMTRLLNKTKEEGNLEVLNRQLKQIEDQLAQNAKDAATTAETVANAAKGATGPLADLLNAQARQAQLEVQAVQQGTHDVVAELEKRRDAIKAEIAKITAEMGKGLTGKEPDAYGKAWSQTPINLDLTGGAEHQKALDAWVQNYLAAMATMIQAAKGNHDQIIALENDKLRVLGQIYGTDSKQYQEALREKIRTEQQFADEATKLQVKQTNDQVAELSRQLSAGVQHDQSLYQQHLISASEERQLELDLTNSIYQQELALLDKQIALLKEGTEAWQAEMDKRKQIFDKWGQDVQKINDKAAQQQQQEWKQALQPIESSFNTTIQGMLTRQQTFQQAVQSGLQQLVSHEISMNLQRLTDWVATELAKSGATETENALRTASNVEAAGASGAAESKSTLASITKHAASAAAAVYDDIAQIPYVGPVLAPIAAGAAFVAVEAFGALVPSFDVGTPWVANTGLAMVHEGEAIIPAAGNPWSPEASAASATNVAITIQAMDGASAMRVFSRNRDSLISTIRTAIRDGRNPLPQGYR